MAAAGAAADFQRRFEALARNIETFIRGKPAAVRLALVCLFAEGHLLIEDVPGVAKTSLASAIGRSVRADVRRIQFTPDLLPSDVTGVRVWDPDKHEFEFRPGPVFANILIADEINRASPKTQSALLEVMAERQVTVAGDPVALDRPFLCVATQNPVEARGTYELPEAQLDRFMMRIRIGYPGLQDEQDILDAALRRRTANDVSPVLTLDQLRRMFDIVAGAVVSPGVLQYIALLVRATRDRPELRLGASPRGGVALAMCAQAMAMSMGRHFATIDDVQALAVPVLAHRLLVTPEALLDKITAEDVVQRVLAEVPTAAPTRLR
ncbi:MoxR family ATPase [Frankia sp. AgB1.9]|nr:MoxR family ATPase [Frankia sp. AgW1.1]MBL7548947.1 MoxR family ATPase [Frankia sp. AgB1.9]